MPCGVPGIIGDYSLTFYNQVTVSGFACVDAADIVDHYCIICFVIKSSTILSLWFSSRCTVSGLTCCVGAADIVVHYCLMFFCNQEFHHFTFLFFFMV